MTYHIIFFFSFILIYPIRKIQESQEGLKLNGANGLPVYVDENVNAIMKNIEALLDDTKTV
jgi:hypothetical protein